MSVLQEYKRQQEQKLKEGPSVFGYPSLSVREPLTDLRNILKKTSRNICADSAKIQKRGGGEGGVNPLPMNCLSKLQSTQLFSSLGLLRILVRNKECPMTALPKKLSGFFTNTYV